MSIEIARYQFHSWSRRGIASNITSTDDLGSNTATDLERAQVPISVKLNESGITKNFALIGPGDIIGINRDMIIRTEPRNLITDHEPNYLAFLEFYDEDFPWRYTPAAAQGERLRPWLAILVLKETEFEKTKKQVPLPSLIVNDKSALQPATETWLWGHVHSNADIPDAELSDYEKFILSLNKTMNDDPDQLFSRLVCPRKLEPNTAYNAFLVPAFETGRLAGLELPTKGIHAQKASWDQNGVNGGGEIPFYFEWFFRTGDNVDFESLVKLLEPRPMPKEVGIRNMDTSHPGFIKADGSGPLPATSPLMIGLEGALKSPSTVSTVFPNPPSENTFQQELQQIVNLPAIVTANLTEDPIISVPFYGKNHAKKSSTEIVLMDITESNWINDLNKDPRTRVAAGFGTLVVQKNQEDFMKKAWEQVTKVLEANRQIRNTRLLMMVSFQYTQQVFSKFSPPNLLAVSQPMLKKVMGSPTTILHQIQESRLPAIVFTGPFRRLVRPGGNLRRRLDQEKPFDYTSLVEQLKDGKITAAPARPLPAGVFTTADIASVLAPKNIPVWLQGIWRHWKIWWLVLLLLFIVLAIFAPLGMIFAALAILTALAYLPLQNLANKQKAANEILDPAIAQRSIQQLPAQPKFTLVLSDETTALGPTSQGNGKDSLEGANFRKALSGLNQRLAITIPDKIKTEIDLVNSSQKMGRAIHPHTAYPLRLSGFVKLPKYITFDLPEKIFPAMAYPDIDEPMYKKLSDISSELLLPNLNLIPQNTISLLVTNQKFIESYLVGLNHEMGQELLWREYPTDQRGSYFRQFWDVKGIIRPPEPGKTEAQLKEEYKDIKPIDTWKNASELGRHNNRDAEGDAQQVVLVLRGDLLKRYPNTIIFAQKAVAGLNPGADPVIDLDLDSEEFKKQVKFPLYKADISPDLKFFGFDLTLEEARGEKPSKGFSDTLGWFFILQEVPGEPRFGMDTEFNAGSDGLTWDDLSWKSFGQELKFIQQNVKPTIHPTDNTPERWGTHAANMAYILFQKPSMVAIHAKEMLENLQKN